LAPLVIPPKNAGTHPTRNRRRRRRWPVRNNGSGDRICLVAAL